MIPLSPAGQALGWSGSYGGDLLRTQADEETDEVRKRRQQQAQQAGASPAGSVLAGMGVLSF
jgi:hypothetical protein